MGPHMGPIWWCPFSFTFQYGAHMGPMVGPIWGPYGAHMVVPMKLYFLISRNLQILGPSTPCFMLKCDPLIFLFKLWGLVFRIERTELVCSASRSWARYCRNNILKHNVGAVFQNESFLKSEKSNNLIMQEFRICNRFLKIHNTPRPGPRYWKRA